MRYQVQKLVQTKRVIFNRLAVVMSAYALVAGVGLVANVSAQDTPPPVGQQQGEAEGEAELIRKSSEIIGFETMSEMIESGIPINVQAFIAGMTKAFQQQKLDMGDEEIMATKMAFQRLAQQKMEAKMEQKANAAKAEEQKFMASHAQKEGVKQLPNGVLYEVLNEGQAGGELAKATDTVSIHYHGMLLDGTVFDSSVRRGEPAQFPVSGVVPGFSQSLQAMKVGDKWRVVIPSELAYGVRGSGPIGPNQTLVFEIELLQIVN